MDFSIKFDISYFIKLNQTFSKLVKYFKNHVLYTNRQNAGIPAFLHGLPHGVSVSD